MNVYLVILLFGCRVGNVDLELELMALKWSEASLNGACVMMCQKLQSILRIRQPGLKVQNNKIVKMLPILIYLVAFSAVNCEPETVRDNFDYFSYGNSEDLLKSLDLHMVGNTV